MNLSGTWNSIMTLFISYALVNAYATHVRLLQSLPCPRERSILLYTSLDMC